jgi:hypothetical protein
VKRGRILAAATSVGFFAVAALHGSGYAGISRMASGAGDDLRVLVPMLWVSFSVDLTVLGLIVAVAALRPNRALRIPVALAGVVPAAAAVLQIVSMGFIPPTAILIALAVLTWTAAVTLEGT